MTSRLQNKHKCLECCNCENNDATKNALSGIIANDLKFSSINSIESLAQ